MKFICIVHFFFTEHDKSRKRTRNPSTHKKNKLKKLVEMGIQHKTKSNRIVAGKVFRIQTTCCDKICATKIDVRRQEDIFSTYYTSLNWNSKTLFIRSCVSFVNCVSKTTLNPVIKLREQKRKLKFSFVSDSGVKIDVCKKFFLECIQVTYNRVYRAVMTQLKNPDAKEQRGYRPSPRKTNNIDMNFLIEFINKFPRYKSHYGRASTDKEYLSPHLNIMKMYREYKIVCEFRQTTILSEYIFRETFNKKFNLSFKKPKIDTCKECDVIDRRLVQNILTFEERRIEQEKKR